MSDTKPKDTKVFDVAKPGTSAPSTNSRPVIVTNRPVLKDPMVVTEATETSEAITGETPASSSSVVAPSMARMKIEPITKEPAKSGDEAPQQAAETTPEITETESSEDEISDAPNNAKPSAKDEEQAALKEAERAAEIDRLAISHKYYLPINQLERRRNRHYAIAGIVLIIILGLAWADISLDAGIVSIPGVKAPTHFFK